MVTSIGQSLAHSRWRAVCAGMVGAGVVTLDMLDARWGFCPDVIRFAYALAGMVVLGVLTRWDRGSLGLCLRPLQGYRYWVKVTLVIALVLLAWLSVAFVVYKFAVRKMPDLAISFPSLAPEQFWPRLARACLYAPLVEETIYRLVFCVALMQVLRPTATIIVGGMVFAGLHFLYGNPSPDNFVAGYFLVWAYLKSGCFVVPLTLHALGNAFAVAIHLFNWYFMC